MSDKKIHLPMLTKSSITTFHRCPREYQFKYVKLRRSRHKSQALKFGSLFHRGLNAWWQPIPRDWLEAPDIRFRIVVEAMRKPHDTDGAPDPFELVKAETLIAGYTARWGNEPLETVAVEKQFRMPIMVPHDPFRRCSDAAEIRGSIDAIVKRWNGPGEKLHPSTLHNVEHKTTSSDISAGSDYWRHVIALDSQVSTYEAASKAMGYDVRDTIYDVIRKPELQPLKATPEESRNYTKPTKKEPIPRLYANQRENDETPEEYRERLAKDIAARPDWYFQRMTIVRLEHDHAEHARDVVHTAQAIRFAEDHDAWPRSPNACKRYGSWCEFMPVCGGETTIDDDSRFESKTKMHEELSDDA